MPYYPPKSTGSSATGDKILSGNFTASMNTNNNLIEFVSGTSVKSYIDPTGAFTTSGTAIIQSNIADGASSVGIILQTLNPFTTSGAKVLQIKDGTEEVVSIGRVGNMSVSGSVGSQNFFGRDASGFADAPIRLNGAQSNTATATGTVLNNAFTTLSTAGSKITSFQNNSVEKAYVDKDGAIYVTGVFLPTRDRILEIRGSSSQDELYFVDQTTGLTRYHFYAYGGQGYAIQNPGDSPSARWEVNGASGSQAYLRVDDYGYPGGQVQCEGFQQGNGDQWKLVCYDSSSYSLFSSPSFGIVGLGAVDSLHVSNIFAPDSGTYLTIVGPAGQNPFSIGRVSDATGTFITYNQGGATDFGIRTNITTDPVLLFKSDGAVTLSGSLSMTSPELNSPWNIGALGPQGANYFYISPPNQDLVDYYFRSDRPRFFVIQKNSSTSAATIEATGKSGTRVNMSVNDHPFDAQGYADVTVEAGGYIYKQDADNFNTRINTNQGYSTLLGYYSSGGAITSDGPLYQLYANGGGVFQTSGSWLTLQNSDFNQSAGARLLIGTEAGPASSCVIRPLMSGGVCWAPGTLKISGSTVISGSPGLIGLQVTTGSISGTTGTFTSLLVNGATPPGSVAVTNNTSNAYYWLMFATGSSGQQGSVGIASSSNGIGLVVDPNASSVNGNTLLGIGKNPLYSLDISGSYVNVDQQLSAYGGYVWSVTGTTSWVMYRPPNTNDLSIYEGGAVNLDRVRIKQGGNVGIGTTGPTALLDVNSDLIRLRTAKTPATSGSAGNAGDICWDSSYIYICVATNSWKRALISAW